LKALRIILVEAANDINAEPSGELGVEQMHAGSNWYIIKCSIILLILE
jgi:hypothetical protein